LLLRVLALWEATTALDDEAVTPDSLRWQALESRVDLCLALLGQLLARSSHRPDRCAVSLSGEHLVWVAAQPLTPGTGGCASLWLSTSMPQPLRLRATIMTCEPAVDGWRITANIRPDNEELQDWLDKTIFRRHRREISERRHRHDA
jgi:hypothetical protein